MTDLELRQAIAAHITALGYSDVVISTNIMATVTPEDRQALLITILPEARTLTKLTPRIFTCQKTISILCQKQIYTDTDNDVEIEIDNQTTIVNAIVDSLLNKQFGEYAFANITQSDVEVDKLDSNLLYKNLIMLDLTTQITV